MLKRVKKGENKSTEWAETRRNSQRRVSKKEEHQGTENAYLKTEGSGLFLFRN